MPQHGFKQGDRCDECLAKPETTHNVNREGWIEGWWEHIDSHPIYIRDKQHLFEECRKRGVMPKAFAHRKSQGSGWEIKR